MRTEQDKVLDDRDPDYGGVGCLISGSPGCGKTTVMAAIALKELKRGNIVVWRAKDTCQWSILLNKTDRMVFWLRKGLDFRMMDRENERNVRIDSMLPVRVWNTPKQLVNSLDRSRINIIQNMPVNPAWAAQHIKFITEWTKILQEMCIRPYAQAITLLFDEVEDLAPEGKFYGKTSMVSDMIKELRKNNVNFFMATQRIHEIYWKMLNKIPWNMYMYGATPLKKSPVMASAIRKLKPGQAYLDGQRFERIAFPMVGREKNYRAVITMTKEERAELKRMEEVTNIRKNKEWYHALYDDVRKNHMTQNEAARKYSMTQQRVSQIIKEIEKTF